jgi:hypothetical protein
VVSTLSRNVHGDCGSTSGDHSDSVAAWTGVGNRVGVALTSLVARAGSDRSTLPARLFRRGLPRSTGRYVTELVKSRVLESAPIGEL